MSALEQEVAKLDAQIAAQQAAREAHSDVTAIRPTDADQRSRNLMRPRTLDGVIGQATAKTLMKAAITRALFRHDPLDHVLLVGPSGTGKSTFSHVVANEMGVAVYEVEAPVSFDTLMQLRAVMRDGDILKIEEIHQQGIMERRGRSAATQPEVLYAVMEDRTIPTESGVLPFPRITVIGTTTDEGLLPDAFLNRFPLRPRLQSYSEDELVLMAARNAHTLGLEVRRNAARLIAAASRHVPREVNNLVKNCALFVDDDEVIDRACVREVLRINGTTEDGLTGDMQAMLRFLLTRGRRQLADGTVRYQASVNTIATGIGKSRDSKAIALRVEPFLIAQGYVQVAHGGRTLTDQGVERARELTGEA